MIRKTILCGAVLALAGCTDPLREFDRIEDIDVAEGAAAAAIPSDAEVAREGFFGTSAARGEDAGATPLAAAPPEAPARGGGLLGLFGGGGVAAPANGTGADAQQVTYGTALPFGSVARVCGARGKSLGQKVEKASARGYVLHDSAPGSAVARTYYITGFADGCPRQFTATTALFGAPSLYEQVHYGAAAQNVRQSPTDLAYEKVKAKICRTGRGNPCGARIDALERNTVFVSTYENFEHNTRWSDMLIHDGEVVASSVKSAR